MPYKCEKMNIPETHDRRRKLTSAQKAEILHRYETEGRGLMSFAEEYGVSKKTILLIVNPESKAKNDRRIKEHWRDYAPSTREHTDYIRKWRREKKKLYDAGILIPAKGDIR